MQSALFPDMIQPGKADRLRAMADTLQRQIDEKRDPGISHQNLTARRARIAAGISQDADRLEKIQQVLRGMADAIDAHTLPTILGKIDTRTLVEQILFGHFSLPYVWNSTLKKLWKFAQEEYSLRHTHPIIHKIIVRINLQENGLYLRNIDEVNTLDEILECALKKSDANLRYEVYDKFKNFLRLYAAGFRSEADFLLAKSYLEKYACGPSPEVLRIRKLKELEASLLGWKLDGFFPTPRSVVERMLDWAAIESGSVVLEPSAGKGDIADVIREKYPEVSLTLIEIVPKLCEILRTKGYDPLQEDFLDHQGFGRYDRIVMNPPFEHSQDIHHVRHAYKLLAPGGRLVAIMSEGPFFRDDSAARDFREWLEGFGNTNQIKLQSGAFTGQEAFRQTGVATRIIMIEKEQ